MTVTVQLFAGLREAVGQHSVQVTLPAGATIADLRRQLSNEYPALGSDPRRLWFAIGTDYVSETAVVPAGESVACFPPVSGG